MIKKRGAGLFTSRSLYLGLLKNIILGLVIAVILYLVLRVSGYYFINNYYLAPERQQQRREEYLGALQDYATDRKLASEDTAKLAEWAREHPYVYLLIYKDDQLFFTSDMYPDKDESSGDSTDTAGGTNGSTGEGNENDGVTGDGGGGDKDNTDKDDGKNDGGINFGDLGFGSLEEYKQNREELIAEAEAHGLHPIELVDGTLIAALTEFTQELYFDIANIVSFAAAVIALVVVLIIYMRRVIAKIKRLETDVTIVSHIDMNHRIVCEGSDELTRLSRGVETMRNSILENLKKEREARAANTELVTSVSHDIRTPLTVLLGYIDMMKTRADGDEVMKGYIAASESTAMRLKQLSDDMFKYALTFGDTEKGIKLEEYDAKTLVDQLLSEHLLLLSESGYEVNVTSAHSDVLRDGDKILTDAQNLMRIVDNVFSNLYKYADAAYPVEMKTVREGGRVIFTCKNRVLENPEGAESNGIGLKTCARLASFVAESFSAERVEEYFEVRIALKVIPVEM